MPVEGRAPDLQQIRDLGRTDYGDEQLACGFEDVWRHCDLTVATGPPLAQAASRPVLIRLLNLPAGQIGDGFVRNAVLEDLHGRGG
jgi:hypothetical protein